MGTKTHLNMGKGTKKRRGKIVSFGSSGLFSSSEKIVDNIELAGSGAKGVGMRVMEVHRRTLDA